MRNTEIVDTFELVADLLELRQDNPYRIRAYRNAARTIDGLSQELRDLIDQENDLSELPDIGEDLAGRIETMIDTGSLPLLEDLKKNVPVELTDMLQIEGLGPKRVSKLWHELGITTLDELRKAAESGEVEEVKGIGEKTVKHILEDLEGGPIGEKRTRYDRVVSLVRDLESYLDEPDHVDRVVTAGSFRRRKETVGDLDLLVITDQGGDLADHFTDFEEVDEVVSTGDTRSTVVLSSGMQVDVRAIGAEHGGAALLYFTGSKQHNIKLRELASDEGHKINEYGVFEKADDGDRIAGETEEDIYDLYDLAFIEPELRENRGEIEAAREDELPDLIERDDIRGDLQSHSTDSDGRASLREMAEAAKEVGHEYLAITDHSKHVGITEGLDADELREQMDQIDNVNKEMDDVRLLKSVEVDLLKDGSLALEDDVLEDLDLVVCSVHTNFGLSERKQTDRILTGMAHPLVDVFAHPTGRKIGERDPYDVNVHDILEGANEHGCILELNAQPNRLDLNDVYCKNAKDLGVQFAISTDAHHPDHLSFMQYGVNQARRGWLEPDDVVNTRTWTDLNSLLTS